MAELNEMVQYCEFATAEDLEAIGARVMQIIAERKQP